MTTANGGTGLDVNTLVSCGEGCFRTMFVRMAMGEMTLSPSDMMTLLKGLEAVSYAAGITGVAKAVAGKAVAKGAYERQGGRYGDLIADGAHRHHIPANQASNLSKTDGPAIRMSPEDHRKTASYGRGLDAQAYRARESELIRQGKFDEAFLMDVNDIQSKFGSKYDRAILEAMDVLP